MLRLDLNFEDAYLDEVLHFVYDLNITPAPGHVVPAHVIYYHYLLWKQKQNSVDILSRKGFFKRFRYLFKRHRGSGFRYYNVNQNSFDMSLKTKLEARKLWDAEKEWYGRKRK